MSFCFLKVRVKVFLGTRVCYAASIFQEYYQSTGYARFVAKLVLSVTKNTYVLKSGYACVRVVMYACVYRANMFFLLTKNKSNSVLSIVLSITINPSILDTIGLTDIPEINGLAHKCDSTFSLSMMICMLEIIGASVKDNIMLHVSFDCYFSCIYMNSCGIRQVLGDKVNLLFTEL